LKLRRPASTWATGIWSFAADSVALRAAAERSPLRHGENGLVADNAFEFAECVLELWKDAELCRRLGNAARETIAQEFSNTRLTEGLSEIVCS